MVNIQSNLIKILLCIVLVLIIGIVGIAFSTTNPMTNHQSALNDIPVYRVQLGSLKINVIESGTIRPREQIILKNEMDDRATILFVVPEGTHVKKNDLLVELDATQQEREHNVKKLEVQNEEAAYISARENLKVVQNQVEADMEQAELQLQFAQKDLKKYMDGDYPKLLLEARTKITIAEEELNRTKDRVKWSKILYDEKYLSLSELQQDELLSKKAELNLQLANEDLNLLMNFTHERQLSQLNSDVRQSEMALLRTQSKATASIIQASASYKHREANLEDEKDELIRIEENIKKAKTNAPIDGVALYASSVVENWDNNEDRIREGASVAERGEIIYLPTVSSYNVDIKIQETDLNKVKPGQLVEILVDSLPGTAFQGSVMNISTLPDQQQRYLNPNLKLYNVDIAIEGETESLRNGMSCRAEIIVKEYANVAYVPIQTVFKVEGQTVVYLKQNNMVEMRPIQIGLDNNRMIHVLDGLQDGDLVLLEPPLNAVSMMPNTIAIN